MFRRVSPTRLLAVAALALLPISAAAVPASAQPSLVPGSFVGTDSVPSDVLARPNQPTRGCGGGQQNVVAPAIAELPRVQISIYDGFFLPSEVTVPRGSVVVWTNRGSEPHTTTAWNRWDSGVLRPGESCEAWFVTPGTYSYLSIVAADGGAMAGTITVDSSQIGTRTQPVVATDTTPADAR
jgi:plastocyanin